MAAGGTPPPRRRRDGRATGGAADGRRGGGLVARKPGDRLVVEVDAPTCALLFYRIQGPSGMAQISVDGKPVCTCDGWFAQTWGGYTPYQLLWRDSPGRHVVTIEVLEKSNPKSTGHEFEVDAFLTAGN